MKEFISGLGVIPSASGPMKIFCDNTGAIALAKESRFHKRTKHIKRRFNSIRDQVKEGDIEICKIHTNMNVANPLTIHARIVLTRNLIHVWIHRQNTVSLVSIY